MQLIYSVVYLLYSKVICYTYIYTHIHICTHIFTHTYMYTYIILHCILLQYEYSSLCYTVGICLSIFIYSSSYLLIQNYKFIPPPPPLVIVSLFSFSHSLSFFFFFLFLLHWQLVGSQLPDQGLNPHPQQWKRRVLTTGSPGNPFKFVS